MSVNKDQIDPKILEQLRAELREELVEEHNQEKAKLREEIQQEYNQELAEMQQKLAEAKKNGPSPEVLGSVTLAIETPDSKRAKKVTVGITDGHPNIRPVPGSTFVISSELFLKFAAGKLKDEKVLSDLEKEGCTKESAQALLADLLAKESAMIKVID